MVLRGSDRKEQFSTKDELLGLETLHIEVEMPNPTGRFIRIQNKNLGALTLAEVVVTPPV